jgi:glutamate dehydrogenase (NADP+)
MTELSEIIGEDTDVPAGDIGVGAREIGYLFGQYKKLTKTHTGVLTGKGVGWGGSLIRTEATGYGLVYFVRNILQTNNQDFTNKIVAVSGSGNVAQYAVEKVIQLGGRVVSMSDSEGTVYIPQGITLEQLEYIKDLKIIDEVEFLNLPCLIIWFFWKGKILWGLKDIQIALPCATQNEIQLADAQN